jgi:hypothetical protein
MSSKAKLPEKARRIQAAFIGKSRLVDNPLDYIDTLSIALGVGLSCPDRGPNGHPALSLLALTLSSLLDS